VSSNEQMKQTRRADKKLETLELNIKHLKRVIATLQEENIGLKKQIDSVKRDQIEYLQNVSHQLVAPLNAIKWHVENLTEGRYSNIERITKVLRSIYSQATISVHLAKNFALMSNLEADHKLTALKEPPSKVNIFRLLVNLSDDFQPLAWDKDVQIQVLDDPFETVPDVWAIKNLVSQVFSNIIENAVKYSKSNTTISVSGFHDSTDNTVCIKISNFGIPLPEGQLEQVFVRGFRTPEARNTYPAGTGFGMYIAKRIVDIHDGEIRCTKGENGLTIFEVKLKVKPS